jgi:hypothetical protein
MNLATGHRFPVAATAADESQPAIAGRWVVWHQMSGPDNQVVLMRRDIRTMSEPEVLLRIPAGWSAEVRHDEAWLVVHTSQFLKGGPMWRLEARPLGSR